MAKMVVELGGERLRNGSLPNAMRVSPSDWVIAVVFSAATLVSGWA